MLDSHHKIKFTFCVDEIYLQLSSGIPQSFRLWSWLYRQKLTDLRSKHDLAKKLDRAGEALPSINSIGRVSDKYV